MPETTRGCCQAKAEGLPREVADQGACTWPDTDCWVNGPSTKTQRPCPTCSTGYMRQDPDGTLTCNNCLWDSEEDGPYPAVAKAARPTRSGADDAPPDSRS